MKLFKCFLILFLALGFSCKDTIEASSEKEILSFVVEGQATTAQISSESATVYLAVDSLTDLTSLAPQIEVSEKATILPASLQTVDFSSGPVNYSVTAEDNSTKSYEVTVEPAKSDAAEILSFYLRRQNSPAVIGDSTISIEVKIGTDVANLAPEITISPKASISPASGVSVDFSKGPVNYVVTAENGNQKTWTVAVESEKIYEANILTYTIPGQIGETVFEGSSVYIEVPVGYDLSNVVPTITTTENTSIEPQSGVAVNFAESGYVDYVVTTEIDSKKSWRVYVTEEVIKPTHPYIQYMGRVDFTDSLAPRLYAPGTAILTKFKGTYIQILLNDQERYGSYHNYVEIIVDGAPTRIQLPGKKNTLDLVKDLPNGEHTLMLVKDTEAGIGFIELEGFRCDELLAPDPLPDRRMEFIGNSITCGYGNDDSDIACGTGEWYDAHNAWLAYGPEVARRLNAQWMLSSVSGIGMIHSCCDMTYEIADVYNNYTLSTGTYPWDFSKYTADVVTICLGQNDGIQDSAAFCSAYVQFVGTVRAHYPNAQIVCMSSPMADDNLLNAQKKYLTGVVDYLNSHGDTQVHKLYVTNKLNSGCDYHPDAAEHQLTADEVEAFIKQIMGW